MIPDNMRSKLDKFFSEKTIMDVDRSSFLNLELKDNSKKITICLIFLKDWNNIECNGYDIVLIKGVGAVLIFPAYWVSVPKELCMSYFTSVIDSLYNDYFNTGNSNSDQMTGSNNHICGCPPCGIV